MNTKITVALTTPQADWLRSTAKREAISIASVVRGMIDSERRLDASEAESAKVPIAPVPEVVRGYYGVSQRPAMSEPGGDPSVDHGRKATYFNQSGWSLYLDGASLNNDLTEAQAIAWCLKGVLP